MTSAKGTRVNARLPPDVARKVTYLQHLTKRSTTEVIRESIERYYAAETSRETPARLLAEAGFVGCADGPPDLSDSYKQLLTRSLVDKT